MKPLSDCEAATEMRVALGKLDDELRVHRAALSRRSTYDHHEVEAVIRTLKGALVAIEVVDRAAPKGVVDRG